MPPKVQVNQTQGAKEPGVSFTVRVSAHQHKALEALAALDQVSVSELVREILDEGVDARLDPNVIAQKLKQQNALFKQLVPNLPD